MDIPSKEANKSDPTYNLTLKLMTNGRFCLAHPGVTLKGESLGRLFYLITDIPLSTDKSWVVVKANQTGFAPHVYEARFDQIGPGKLVKMEKR
ncbi:MAG: hypothetical protein KKB70_09000 [Proteobacteria bacterium]|nr:hypothetical protein [Pseudomonadota bacterium]MBU1610709.1 hypothetical protein [Pseudomonadota bacterium]